MAQDPVHILVSDGDQRRSTFVGRIGSNRRLALLAIALPEILHFLVFRYAPLLGNVIAFQDYDIFAGILKSRWVGLIERPQTVQ